MMKPSYIAQHQEDKIALFTQATMRGKTIEQKAIVERDFPGNLLYGTMSIINYKFRNKNGTPVRASQLLSAYALYAIENQVKAMSLYEIGLGVFRRDRTTVWLPTVILDNLPNYGYYDNGTLIVKLLSGVLRCEDETIIEFCHRYDSLLYTDPKHLGLEPKQLSTST